MTPPHFSAYIIWFSLLPHHSARDGWLRMRRTAAVASALAASAYSPVSG